MLQEKSWKKQTFQNYGFLKISLEAETHTNPKSEFNEFPYYRKHKPFPGPALTHAIPNVLECANSHNMEVFY